MAIGTLFGGGSESSGLYGIATGSAVNPTVVSQTYFEWFIFTTSAGAPATPTGGSWNFTSNIGTPPTGWTNAVTGVPLNSLWFSIAFVDSRNPLAITWSTPGLISSQSVYATAYADVFTGNGSTVAWTLSNDPVVVNNTDVSINGVTQVPTTDYTISGTTLTTSTAAPLNAIILVKYRQALPLSYYGAASNVQFTPVGALTATNVQAAIAEVVTDLALSSGSSTVGYLPAGTGAVATTVQAKLRETLISRNDYSTTGDFNTAVVANPTIPSLDGSGNFSAKITPTGEPTQINLSDAVLTIATSNRAAVRYYSATAVSITCPRHILMGGFRFFGQYTKARVPLFSRTTGSPQTVSVSTDLGAESTAHLDGWYAVFACADNSDATPSFKVMPYLRAGTVAGSTITLCSGAEGIHTNTATTYAWSSTNNLAGTECLVINETVNGRANAFSGRTTTITANTATTVTLTDIGAIAAFDFILPAPPGFDNFCYMGSFYYETPGDVRNIGDSGSLVKAKMINTADPNWSATGQIGTIAAPVAIHFGGYVCPLATGVVVKDNANFNTASTGTYAAYFDIDGSQHIVQTILSTKEAAANETQLMDGITVPFCFTQAFYYSNTGTIIAQRSGGTLEITGWIEN